RLASVLHAHGLGCRIERTALENHESGQDHVGLCLLNSPEYLEAMLGAYRARVAPFNVNYRYVDDELLYLLQDADAAGLVYHARYAPTLGRIRDRLPRLRLLLQVDDGAAQWAAFGALHQGGTVVLQGRPERLDPDDLWGTVEREGVNLLVLVGDAFARPLLDGLDRRSYDLSRLFVIVSGGAILSPHLKQALLERVPHATVIDGFGASETGGHGTRSTRAGEPATTGTFSMADTVVLREDLSGALPPGSPEVGWVARMGHVPLGYYKDA